MKSLQGIFPSLLNLEGKTSLSLEHWLGVHELWQVFLDPESCFVSWTLHDLAPVYVTLQSLPLPPLQFKEIQSPQKKMPPLILRSLHWPQHDPGELEMKELIFVWPGCFSGSVGCCAHGMTEGGEHDISPAQIGCCNPTSKSCSVKLIKLHREILSLHHLPYTEPSFQNSARTKSAESYESHLWLDSCSSLLCKFFLLVLAYMTLFICAFSIFGGTVFV